MKLDLVFAAASFSAVALMGCGGAGGDVEPTGNGTTAAPHEKTTSPAAETTTTTMATTTTTTTLGMIKAIAYGPLPTKTPARPTQAMPQIGYELQWGPKGRDDLANIKALGANTVRLYHSFGLETKHSHKEFLDHADKLGLKVMPGVHSDQEEYRADLNVHKCGDDFDCFDYVKSSILTGLKKQGYASDGKWHPAVSTVILLNEPDFLDTTKGPCNDNTRWCSNKVVLSSLEAVLAAEKDAGVEGTVSITTCYSLAQRTSIDGKVSAPGVFGFQDMDAITNDPSLAKYKPRTSQKELRDAFESRWHHCMNIPTAFSVALGAVQKWNDQGFTFGNRPWFLGEMAFAPNLTPDGIIKSDFKEMEKEAKNKNSLFQGFGFFQYQTAYWKAGSYEKQFGMFGLGDKVIGEAEVCNDGGFYFFHEEGCQKWEVNCLTLPKDGEPGAGRAAAVAKAWGGSLDDVITCDKMGGEVVVA